MKDRIKIGISSCLLGQEVRYDGGHKLDRFLKDTLGQHVKYLPVCPEVECGFGVPREAFQLVGDPQSPRFVTVRTRQDYTERMARWAKKRAIELEKEDLWGFIFKTNSPSSGMARVKVYNEKGMPEKKGVGMFARAFMEHFPLIPVEDEGRLHDPGLRGNFIERVFVLREWREVLKKKRAVGNLVDFHTRQQLLTLSHSEKHHRMMGRLVAGGKELPIGELYQEYEALLMEALKFKTTPRKNTHVFHHIMGCLEKQLSPNEKQELFEIINEYRKGCIPLIVPITLMNHYVRRYKQPHLSRQTYLHPHPVAILLRNHV